MEINVFQLIDRELRKKCLEQFIWLNQHQKNGLVIVKNR